MARKLNPLKQPRTDDVPQETLDHRSQPAAATLYLMQLRAHAVKIAPSESIRLEIDAEHASEEEQPVKITWIDDNK